jgi:hypothetical protein
MCTLVGTHFVVLALFEKEVEFEGWSGLGSSRCFLRK